MKQDPKTNAPRPPDADAEKRDRTEGLANQSVTQPASPGQPAPGSKTPQPARRWSSRKHCGPGGYWDWGSHRPRVHREWRRETLVRMDPARRFAVRLRECPGKLI